MVDTVRFLEKDRNGGTFKSEMASNCPECGIPYIGFNVPWVAYALSQHEFPFSQLPTFIHVVSTLGLSGTNEVKKRRILSVPKVLSRLVYAYKNKKYKND